MAEAHQADNALVLELLLQAYRSSTDSVCRAKLWQEVVLSKAEQSHVDSAGAAAASMQVRNIHTNLAEQSWVRRLCRHDCRRSCCCCWC